MARVIQAGGHQGLDAVVTTPAFAYGDVSSNFIQPFGAIPLLSVTRVAFGEIMGYCLLFFAACLSVTMLAVSVMPLMM